MLNGYCYTAILETAYKKGLRLVLKCYQGNVFTIIYFIYVYKEDLTLNNLQWLICHKTQPNQTLSQSGPGSNGNEGVLRIPQSSMTGASPSDGLRRCPWCSRYRRREMNTATRVQILDETDCISHSTNTLGEGMNPIILPPAMGK